MGKMIGKEFFNRKTEQVAKELLGKKLIRVVDEELHTYLITEVEAYVGPHDLACHSSKGRTGRTEVMYQEPGTLYVYLIYGMHYMLNIVTEKEGFPAAVLIRGVKGISGPGRVAKELRITKELNGKVLSAENGIWIEEGVKPQEIIRTPRIGVSYAGEEWANKKLRFLLSEEAVA